MNANIFSQWLTRQGYQVAQTESSRWYEAAPRVYQAFPFHWVIDPGEKELTDFLVQHHAMALRYSAPWHSDRGCISYHTVYDKPHYALKDIDRRTRQNIRKGLKNCKIKKCSSDLLAREGWALEADTLARQGRRDPLQGCERWQKRCTALDGLPGFEIWGAFVNDRLAASMLTIQMGECCEMISQQCHRDFLKARVNNALTYSVTQTMIDRPGIKQLFYSLHSLDAPESVDTYKFRMGYEAKPVRQRVVFHPWLTPFVDRLALKMASALHYLYPSNRFWSKTEGVLRFYQQGKRTLDHQNWPVGLADVKNVLLERNQALAKEDIREAM
jgi:hypothetical protein